MTWQRRAMGSLAPGLFLATTGAIALTWSLIRVGAPIDLPSANPLPATDRLAPADTPRLKSGQPTQRSAVAQNPFRPDRRPAPEPFRMPGEAAPGISVPVPTGAIVLIGTAVLPEGEGFAMCQIGAEPARLVRVGQRFAGYLLRSVSPGRAVFRSATGGLMDVAVAKVGR